MSDVVTLLEELKIDYEFINHEITIKSAQEGADYFGIEIGHGLPTIMDRQMNRYTYIYGGTGKINSTLKINVSDIERLNNVIAYVR